MIIISYLHESYSNMHLISSRYISYLMCSNQKYESLHWQNKTKSVHQIWMHNTKCGLIHISLLVLLYWNELLEFRKTSILQVLHVCHAQQSLLIDFQGIIHWQHSWMLISAFCFWFLVSPCCFHTDLSIRFSFFHILIYFIILQ